MTTLRVIVDDILLPGGGPVSRYAEDLTRALIQTAPRGSGVSGVVAASPEGDYARLRELLTGMRQLHKSALARRQLTAAWQHGFTVLPGTGMVHAPSLFAPLRRHDRSVAPGDQTVVTIHDALAWTHPELLPPRVASWTKAMGRRAERHADAVVVPSHAVADDLEGHLDLGDRVRVIGTAPATMLTVPADARARRAARGLPERYVVGVVESDAANGFVDLAATSTALGDVPIVLLASTADAAAIGAQAVTVIEDASAADRVAILAGAAVFVQPSVAAGSPAILLDALSLGLPIVATALPAIAEVTADAAILVERGDDSFALAEAIRGLLDDASAAERAGVAAADRAKAFTWRDAAEKVWQLHADL